jgi:hypothetical protein
LLVRNIGNAPTGGPITVMDQLPTGVTLISASGNLWDCTNSTATKLLCVRNAILNGGRQRRVDHCHRDNWRQCPPVVINTAVADTLGDLVTANNTSIAVCPRNPAPAPALAHGLLRCRC